MVGFAGFYEVSSSGMVRSLSRPVKTRYGTFCVRPGRVLKTGKTGGNGRYHCVVLCVNNIKHPKLVHCLVLEAFSGPRPPGQQARHFPDRNTDNNNANNLIWGTVAQNADDRRVHGTVLEGDRNPRCKIKSSEHASILRRLVEYGPGGMSRLAREYGVTPTAIYCIKKKYQ